MIYILDSGTLINLFRHYYRSRFPSLWDRFDAAASARRIVSVREVYNEVADYGDQLGGWAKANRSFFEPPSEAELDAVADIFAVPHFQSMVRTQERLQGKPVADPFVIAKARVARGCVVTEEDLKPNAARIPNVCEHFGVPCLKLEGFMELENWTF